MTSAANQFTSSLIGDNNNLKLINEIPVNLENVEKVTSFLSKQCFERALSNYYENFK